jgi:hypothetical protein
MPLEVDGKLLPIRRIARLWDVPADLEGVISHKVGSPFAVRRSPAYGDPAIRRYGVTA